MSNLAQCLVLLFGLSQTPPAPDEFTKAVTDLASRDRKVQEGKSKTTGGKPRAASRKDNPYLRPFGKLSTEELERSIQETEKAIVQCQAGFGNPEVFKDASRGQKLHDDYEALEKKLKQLEEEYFTRGK
jgi:hypothetical protein